MLISESPDTEPSFPSKWEEVTLGKYINLHERRHVNDDGVVEFSLGDALESFASDLALLNELEAGVDHKIKRKLSFLGRMPNFEKLPVPETVLAVKPPKELGKCKFFQKRCIEKIIAEMEEEQQEVDYFTLAIPLLSVYLYPLITGSTLTDISQLDTITDLILSIPCTDALPLSAFFLTNYQSPITSGRTNYYISYPKARQKRSLIRWFRSWRLTPITRLFARSPKTLG